MYAVVRSYAGPGTSELFDLLANDDQEITDLFHTIPGFVSYTAVRSGADSGTTVTVCQDKAGTDESSRIAAGWVAENVDPKPNAPAVTEGATALHFGA
jgi:hypothetical protein